MRSTSDALRAAALAGVSFPVRAVVRAAYCRPAAAGYAVDLEVVHRATLQPTGELVAAVPLSPLWLGADGRGLYAPPQVGQIVILAWVEGDRGHPFIAGFHGDAHLPARAVASGELVLTDGRGAELRIRDSLWRIANAQDSLRTLLEDLIDEVKGLVTTPGPAAPHDHGVSPATKAKLQALRARLPKLLDS